MRAYIYLGCGVDHPKGQARHYVSAFADVYISFKKVADIKASPHIAAHRQGNGKVAGTPRPNGYIPAA